MFDSENGRIDFETYIPSLVIDLNINPNFKKILAERENCSKISRQRSQIYYARHGQLLKIIS